MYHSSSVELSSVQELPGVSAGQRMGHFWTEIYMHFNLHVYACAYIRYIQCAAWSITVWWRIECVTFINFCRHCPPRGPRVLMTNPTISQQTASYWCTPRDTLSRVSRPGSGGRWLSWKASVKPNWRGPQSLPAHPWVCVHWTTMVVCCVAYMICMLHTYVLAWQDLLTYRLYIHGKTTYMSCVWLLS